MCLADARKLEECVKKRAVFLMCHSLTLVNVSPSANKATTSAMRARTEIDCVRFYIQGVSVRALCGDKVAARWPCQLHCARRCCR